MTAKTARANARPASSDHKITLLFRQMTGRRHKNDHDVDAVVRVVTERTEIVSVIFDHKPGCQHARECLAPYAHFFRTLDLPIPDDAAAAVHRMEKGPPVRMCLRDENNCEATCALWPMFGYQKTTGKKARSTREASSSAPALGEEADNV